MPGTSRLWKSPAEAVLFVTLFLFIIGTVNIFSASFVRAAQDYADSYYFLKRHLISFGLGLILLYIAAKIDYRNYRRLIMLITLLTLGTLVAVHFVGISANGARRWINIGFQFQPSEMAKLAAILVSASYLGPRVERQWRVSLLSAPIVVCLIMSGFILKQPDMGTAVIVMALCVALYLIAGLPLQQRLFLVIIALVMLVYFTYAASYRAERIEAWLNPWAYQQSTGYQTVQSLLAIGSGGFFGNGLGMGASKFYYLPEAHTDFAFAVLCQEMGFVGAILVLCLNGALGLYGGQVARKAADGFGRILAIGLTLLIVGQTVVNIAMVTGILPVIGVPLPFISYGGTSLLVNMMAIGMLISIGRRAALSQPPPEAAPEPQPSPSKSSRRLQLANRRTQRA